jgi:hypothetical protein
MRANDAKNKLTSSDQAFQLFVLENRQSLRQLVALEAVGEGLGR